MSEGCEVFSREMDPLGWVEVFYLDCFLNFPVLTERKRCGQLSLGTPKSCQVMAVEQGNLETGIFLLLIQPAERKKTPILAHKTEIGKRVALWK